MIAAEEVVLVLLAAGRSERFGPADKLAADLLGRPLGLHIVSTLAAVPFRARLAVRTGHDWSATLSKLDSILSPEPAVPERPLAGLGAVA